MRKKKPDLPTVVPASVARARFAELIQETIRKKVRYLITTREEPAAVLMSVTDLDDLLEEVDPEFQESLKAAYKEYKAGKATSLRGYLKSRENIRHAG